MNTILLGRRGLGLGTVFGLKYIVFVCKKQFHKQRSSSHARWAPLASLALPSTPTGGLRLPAGSARFARSALHIRWAGSARSARSALHVARTAACLAIPLAPPVHADARTTALLAIPLAPPVHADAARTTARLAVVLVPPVRADAQTTALLAVALLPPMHTEAPLPRSARRTTALLAAALVLPMHADARTTALLVAALAPPVHTEAGTTALLAVALLPPMHAEAPLPRSALHGRCVGTARFARSTLHARCVGSARFTRSALRLHSRRPTWTGPRPKNRKREKFHVASSFATHATCANVICSATVQLILSEPWTYSPRDRP